MGLPMAKYYSGCVCDGSYGLDCHLDHSSSFLDYDSYWLDFLFLSKTFMFESYWSVSCSVVSDSLRRHDYSPPGSVVPEILQARTLEWVAISFSNAWKWTVKVKLLSRVRLFATPWTIAYQAAPSMGFSRQEYWSGVPLPYMSLIITPNNKMWKHGCFGVFSHLSAMSKLQAREYSYITAWTE